MGALTNDLGTQIVDGLNIVVKQLRNDVQSLQFRETLLSLLPTIQRDHQTRFDNRTSPTGEAWEPWHWTKMTKQGPLEHPTLEYSKRLRSSLRIGGRDNVSDITVDGTKTTLTWGTAVPYAKIHNFGARIRLGIPLVSRDGKGYLPIGTIIHIPQREFIGLSERAINSAAKFILDDAIRQLRK